MAPKEKWDIVRWAMYIDGYNFYYAIKKQMPPTQRYLGWCDFGALASDIIQSRGSLIGIKYFTALVGNLGWPGGKEEGSERERQELWLRAVKTISHLEVIKGFHTGPHPRERKEKLTDVNIATALVLDAASELYDSAILVTGDCDQMPAVRAASEEFARHIEVWLPPRQPKGRWSEFDANPFVRIRSITRDMLERARLPDSIRAPDGTTIEAPKMWRSPVPSQSDLKISLIHRLPRGGVVVRPMKRRR